MSVFQRLLHAGEGKKLKIVESVIPAVASFEAEMERRSDDDLRALTADYKGRIERGEDLDDLLPEAFATVRERPRVACSGNATSTCRSWAAPRCTSAGSPR